MIVKKNTANNTTSNAYGYFSIPNVCVGDTIVVYYMGYYSKEVQVVNATRMDIELIPIENSIDEIVVRSQSTFNRELKKPQMSHHHLTPKDISHNISLFGSSDALKSIQILPGVNAAADGGTNLSVRGGSFDQNMILLDEATIYNPAHSMGIFSAMNTDAVSSVDFYKGAAPAKYGGKLSSVIDMRMREGNNQQFHAEGGIGLVESRLLLEGPISRNKSSFMISGRMGYGDGVTKILDLIDKKFDHSDDIVRFFDFCGKANLNVDENNKIYVSAYMSHDRFRYNLLSQDNNQEWGNKTATFRWNKTRGNNKFTNLTLTYSNYDYLQHQDEDARNFNWEAGMSEVCMKFDADKYLINNHHVIYGYHIEYHKYSPGEIVPLSKTSAMLPIKLRVKDLVLIGLYVGDEVQINKKLNLNYGLHAHVSSKLGRSGKSYICAEPRISSSYILKDNITLKASYSHSVQYQHLLNNSALGLPTDIWAPADKYIKPQQAEALSIGIHTLLAERIPLIGGAEFSVEAYGKMMHHIIDFKDDANFHMNPDIEKDVLSGKGRAAGLEFLLSKNAEKYSAQLTYTLSSVKRKISGVNNGKWYYAVYDQRNNIVLNGQYNLNKKWSFAANFQYHTGGRTTVPISSIYAYGTALRLYTERNGYRMPDFHRLDVSATYNISHASSCRIKQQLVVSLYNLYGRKNAYSMFVRGREGNLADFQGYMMYLYRCVPSVTWRFCF